MAATKASLVAAGFDPTFIDKVIADLGADAAAGMQIFADFQAAGFSVAFVMDLFGFAQKFGPLVLQTVKDIASMFGIAVPGLKAAAPGCCLPSDVIAHAKAFTPLKTAAVDAPSGAFLQWLLAAAQKYGPTIVALLLKIWGIPLPFPIPPVSVP